MTARKTATAEKPAQQPSMLPDLDPAPKPAQPVATRSKPKRPTGTNVVPIQQQAPKTFLEMAFMAARDPRVNVEKFRAMLEIEDTQKKREAERVFGEAMLRVQDTIPPITKDGLNPSTHSKFAKLETIAKKIGRVSRENGFSMSWDTEDCPKPNHYRVVCYLAHRGDKEAGIPGHTRRYQYDVPLDSLGPKGERNKTDTHGAGSAYSYARRYGTVMMFNVVIQDEDDDGTADLGARITEEQSIRLVDMCEQVGADRTRFLAHLGIKTMGALAADRYEAAVTDLNNYAAASERRKKKGG